MSDVEFSKEQLEVINTRSKNILVSAAAGSGKTTVLVERIISKITDETNPVDIDRILVLTFTEAAAGQMRERIEKELENRIAKNPDNERLIRQSVLIHNAHITTIHSFCLSVIRNNFSLVGVDPAFRVAEPGEIKLIEENIVDELTEELFENLKNGEDIDDFKYLADRFVKHNDIKGLKEIILEAYGESRNAPFTEEYFEERRSDYKCDSVLDIAESPWMKYVLKETEASLREAKSITEHNLEDGAYIYADNLQNDLELIEKGLQRRTYDEYYNFFEGIVFSKLSSKKAEDIAPEVREASKNARKLVKDMINECKSKFYDVPLEIYIGRMRENNRVVNALVNVLQKFDIKLKAEKSARKVIDFGDMEHLALQILVTREEGVSVPTKTALEYAEYYDEIMVDEYQDSNRVQEEILDSISADKIKAGFNRFMVGDVKQSIYSFRRACPDIFTDKYESYKEQPENSVKIDLSSNYRSRSEVVDSVNYVFERIMSEDMGRVAYDEYARLNRQANYPESGENSKTELLLLNADKEDSESKQSREALLVANRIQELIGNGFKVYDDNLKDMRPCRYSDIVILLRSNKGWDESFKHVLEECGVPAFVASKTGYFNATEVKELLAMLSILDNPRQEIPLYGFMCGMMGDFTDNEVAAIRAYSKEQLYDVVCNIAQEDCNDIITPVIKDKCVKLMEFVEDWRRKKAYTLIHEILTEIIRDTDYMYKIGALPLGEQRQANVRMLIEKAKKYEAGSFKGLYHFIRYIEEIISYEVDYGEAVTLDENADVVRIMSIHKSKGLEFPICFVCGTAKKYNFRDTSDDVIYDRNYGIGLDYIDTDMNVKYKDIRKQILANHMKQETAAEEMRILYVAMTRAKEKLIMTGTVADAEEYVAEKKREAQLSKEQLLLPYTYRSKADSYLQLIAGCLGEGSEKVFDIRYAGADELKAGIVSGEIDKRIRKEELNEKIDSVIKSDSHMVKDRLTKMLDFEYHHKNLKDLYTKTSVSELKISSIEEKYINNELEDMADNFFTEKKSEQYVPGFISEEKENGGTARGSAYHRVMELFEFSKCADFGQLDHISQRNRIDDVIENMISKGKIDTDVVALVDRNKILNFMNSNLGGRMCRAALAGKLHVEEPFVLAIAADRLKQEFPKEEKILIQGIIDVFFEEDDGIVLMDYKTDSVKNADELIKRYAIQLDYYEEALTRITGIPVKKKIIYSFCLESEILTS